MVASEPTAPPDRLAVARARLAGGFYRRPEVLDRIATAIARAFRKGS